MNAQFVHCFARSFHLTSSKAEWLETSNQKLHFVCVFLLVYWLFLLLFCLFVCCRCCVLVVVVGCCFFVCCFCLFVCLFVFYFILFLLCFVLFFVLFLFFCCLKRAHILVFGHHFDATFTTSSQGIKLIYYCPICDF